VHTVKAFRFQVKPPAAIHQCNKLSTIDKPAFHHLGPTTPYCRPPHPRPQTPPTSAATSGML